MRSLVAINGYWLNPRLSGFLFLKKTYILIILWHFIILTLVGAQNTTHL